MFLFAFKQEIAIELKCEYQVSESKNMKKELLAVYCVHDGSQLRDIAMKSKEDSEQHNGHYKYKQILVHQLSATPATQQLQLAQKHTCNDDTHTIPY